MRRFAVLALALTMFTGAATVSFAQGGPKKTSKRKRHKRKARASKGA